MSGNGVAERLAGVPVGPALAAVLEELTPVRYRAGDDVREVFPDNTEQVLIAQAWQKVVAWSEAGLNRAVLSITGNQLGPEDEDWGREEAAAALRWSAQGTHERTIVARALAGRLFLTGRALAEGRITYRHAAEIVERLEPLDDDKAAEVEEGLLAAARSKTPAQVGRLARKAALKADPKGAEKRAKKARKGRRVDFYALADAMAEMRAILPAADAARVRAALDRIAGRSRSEGDDRWIDARRADALVALTELGLLTADGALPLPEELATANGSAKTGSEPEPEPEPESETESAPEAQAACGIRGLPQRCIDLIRTVLAGKRATPPRVALTAPLSTVLGGSNSPGDLTGYGPIPPSIVRELAASGRWEKWATDQNGVVTDLGRSTYRPTAELADLVRATYPTCMFPGCSQPSYRCDLDHTVRFVDGGQTSAANLVPLCRRHHRAKDEAGWKLHHDSDTGICTWTSPVGRTYTVDPPTHDNDEAAPSGPPADWTVPLEPTPVVAPPVTPPSDDPDEPPPF